MKRSRNKLIVLIMLLAVIAGTLGAAVPMVQSAAQDQAPAERVREVVALRETNSETYLLSDGSYECVVYAGDKYYRDDRNGLKLIDNTLILDEASAKTEKRHYKNTANSFQVTFSDSDTPTVTMTKDDLGITFQAAAASGGNPFQTASTQKAVTVGAVRNCDTLTDLTDTGSDTITYTNAFYSTDLVYVLQNNALKEYIVLKNANAPNAFTFRFSTEGLTLTESDGVGIFLDEQKNEVFRLDRLFAVDGNGDMTEELTYTFASVKGSRDILVTVTLDAEYLAAEDRAFPVVIDPSVMISSAQTADASVYSDYPDTNYQMEKRLRTGKDTTYGKRRAYLRFPLPNEIIEADIISATLDIKKHSGVAPTIRAYQCNRYWRSDTITWNNMPDYTVVNISSQAVPRSSGSAWYQMDVTDIVSYWQDYPEDCFGFVVRDNKESNTDHWTTFYSSDAPSPNKPELHIVYSGEEPNPGTEPDSEDEEIETTPTVPVEVTPAVHLSVKYDFGYYHRYSDAAARATRVSNAVTSFFESNFDISITADTPTLIASYADECSNPSIANNPNSFSYPCECVFGDDCGNTDYQLLFDGARKDNDYMYQSYTYHHKNFYNMLYEMTPLTHKPSSCILLTGHRTCVQKDLYCENTSSEGLYGLANFGRRTCIVSNTTSEESETISAIHEFGHMIGIEDHYDAVLANSPYSNNCIYGANSASYTTVSGIVICSGCRNEFENTVNGYQDYFQ